MTAAAASDELRAIYPALHGLDPRELAEALSGAQLGIFKSSMAHDRAILHRFILGGRQRRDGFCQQ